MSDKYISIINDASSVLSSRTKLLQDTIQAVQRVLDCDKITKANAFSEITTLCKKAFLESYKFKTLDSNSSQICKQLLEDQSDKSVLRITFDGDFYAETLVGRKLLNLKPYNIDNHFETYKIEHKRLVQSLEALNSLTAKLCREVELDKAHIQMGSRYLEKNTLTDLIKCENINIDRISNINLESTPSAQKFRMLLNNPVGFTVAIHQSDRLECLEILPSDNGIRAKFRSSEAIFKSDLEESGRFFFSDTIAVDITQNNAKVSVIESTDHQLIQDSYAAICIESLKGSQEEFAARIVKKHYIVSGKKIDPMTIMRLVEGEYPDSCKAMGFIPINPQKRIQIEKAFNEFKESDEYKEIMYQKTLNMQEKNHAKYPKLETS